MVNIYRSPEPSQHLSNAEPHPANNVASSRNDGLPDTEVPAKARPVLDKISVNDKALDEAQILAEAQHHPASTPGEALIAAARALVVRELLLQEADRLNIVEEPKSDETGNVEMPDDARIRALMEQELATPEATMLECQRFYDNNPQRFTSTPIHEARHILLAASPDDVEGRKKTHAEAVALTAHLQNNNSDFASTARIHSACPSKEQGGNLGQITRGSTVPEFEAALWKLKEGELSQKPVESPYGYHIILLERYIPGQPQPFEMVQERISGWLEASSWSRAIAQYIGILAAAATIQGIDITEADGPLVQ